MTCEQLCEQFKQILSKTKNNLGEEAFILAQCTDKLIIAKLSDYEFDFDKLFKHGFDIRIFSTKGEWHLFRASIDKEFAVRKVVEKENGDGITQKIWHGTVVSDPDAPEEQREYTKGKDGERKFYYYKDTENNGKDDRFFYDEEQFLDIDTTKKPNEQGVAATGGGRYQLPINNYNDAKIRIRNYCTYDEVGRSSVADWRIVKFVEGIKEDKHNEQ